MNRFFIYFFTILGVMNLVAANYNYSLGATSNNLPDIWWALFQALSAAVSFIWALDAREEINAKKRQER